MSSLYRLHRAGQVWWYSLLTRAIDALASLSLAVVLIFTLAATLAFATFVEARYGTPSVQFFVYQTWWFDALLVLLALNVFFAAAVRYPWKRYQTGFVITHIGLLTLIGGAALSRLYGIDSQVIVFEDQTSKWAWGDVFKIKLRDVSTKSDAKEEKDRETEITFRGGPMNWGDYAKKFSFALPPEFAERDWRERLARRAVNGFSGLLFRLPFRHDAGDVIFQRDDVEVKVLDYYANSAMEGPLQLRVGGSIMKRTETDEETGQVKEVAEPPSFSDVPSLATISVRDKKSYPLGLGGKQMMGGGFFTFSLAASDEQVKAFRDSAPKLPLGEKGVVVLGAAEKRLEFAVAEKLGKGKFAFEGTPYEIELAEYFPVGKPKSTTGNVIEFDGMEGATTPDNPLVNLLVWKEGKQVGRLSLFSESPEMNIHDYEQGVFGAYWFDQSPRPMEERMRVQISPRIEILASPDEKLYYRYWNLQQVVAAAELPTQGSEAEAIDAFKMRLGQLKMYVARYTPTHAPGKMPVPVEFSRETPVAQTRPAALLEVTAIDSKGERTTQKKWLRAASADDPTLLRAEDRVPIAGGARNYELTMMLEAIDIGFRVRLDKFERKLDPGTSQASHYSSTVDLLDREHSRELRFLDSGRSRPTQTELPGCEPGNALAVDSLRGDLYLADGKRPVVWRIRDGKEGEISEFTSQVAGTILSLAVDSKARKLYWIETAASHAAGALMGADLDGGDATLVHRFTAAPKHFAVDAENQTAYFIDPASGELKSLDLANKGSEKLVASGFPRAAGLALLGMGKKGPQLYVADAKSGEILHIEDGEETTAFRLENDQTPISLAAAPDGESLLVGVAIQTPRPVDSNKPAAERLPDAILQIDLKNKKATKLTQNRVYQPLAIAADSQSGRIVWIQSASIGERLWITMNAPIDVDDPHSGRSYRLFQESFNGPWLPGTPEFDEIVPASSDKDELYMSVFSVNYDPGRGVRSTGCVLVILGVAVMFFMRAYFFKPRPRAVSAAAVPSKVVSKHPALQTAER